MNMQVPAYCPTFAGIQVEEYNGVSVEVKNTIIMLDMDIMLVPSALVVVDISDMSILAVVKAFGN